MSPTSSFDLLKLLYKQNFPLFFILSFLEYPPPHPDGKFKVNFEVFEDQRLLVFLDAEKPQELCTLVYVSTNVRHVCWSYHIVIIVYVLLSL